jgi:23S rRNA pseudouridine1911/1915/1917 synthase
MSKQLPVTIYENDHFIVINKTAGMLSIPDREGKSPSLKKWLKEKYGSIFTVHRLDRETSGLIVFAKDENTHQFLSEAFEKRSVDKFYLGIVQGTLVQKKGRIEAPIAEHPAANGSMVIHKKGKASMTDYEVMEEFGGFSLLEFQLLTGRTHQIRVHMHSLGHPVVCDALYGDPAPVFISSIKRKFKLSKLAEEERPVLQRLALHASRLHFFDAAGTDYHFEAPLPKDLKALLQQLRKWAGAGRIQGSL